MGRREDETALYGLTGGLWEYALVAHPNETISKCVLQEKNHLLGQERNRLPAPAQPQILLARFLAKEAMEETLVRWMQNSCRLHAGFTLTLDSFGGFPHTIYLRIENSEPLLRLINSLKIIDGFMQANYCPAIQLETRPCLPVASDLDAEVYARALKEFSARSFQASFPVNQLVVVKRWRSDLPFELVNRLHLSQAVA